MTEYKRKLLNNGRDIPLMGLGTHKLLSSTLSEVIYNSIKDGVRLIDNAPSYFNERNVGSGINKALKEKICKREDLVVISKIWINEREDPESAIKKTFTIFNWIIWIFIWIIGLQEKIIGKILLMINLNVSLFMICWPKMEKLVEKGLTKSIGVSNYNIQGLNNLLSFCKIKPVVNEVDFIFFIIH